MEHDWLIKNPLTNEISLRRHVLDFPGNREKHRQMALSECYIKYVLDEKKIFKKSMHLHCIEF